MNTNTNGVSAMSAELGPLPEAANDNRKHGRAGFHTPNAPAYTAEQMREYAAQSVAADREQTRALISNDAHACTFQSLGQYRTALLRFLCRA